jgi:hypothetical protein
MTKPKDNQINIRKSIVREAITTDKDLKIYQNTTFKKSVKCNNIISIGGKWDIDAMDINAMDINAGDINAMDINAMDINAWDINAWDINARNINAGDINAWDINAMDINARNINAGDIDAWDIICEKRIKKESKFKTISRVFIQNKSKTERKEQMP